MGVINFITRGFIDFFGITHPTPKQERQAAWFICGLLALIILVAALVFSLIVMVIGR
jgi:Mg2+ and Co2+ transporter CorA